MLATMPRYGRLSGGKMCLVKPYTESAMDKVSADKGQ